MSHPENREQDRRHRDPADSPRASYRPDIAAEVDTLEDILAEVIAEQGDVMEPGMLRVVVAIAAGALRKADEQGVIQQLFGTSAPVREDLDGLAARMMALIDGDSNPQLQAKCIDFVFGLGLNDGKSQTEIAAEEGVGKACVSQRCIEIRGVLGLPPGRGMKTDAARESYRKRQQGKRARPKPEPWAFAGLFKTAFHGIPASA